jgi:hypothetical protein
MEADPKPGFGWFTTFTELETTEIQPFASFAVAE